MVALDAETLALMGYGGVAAAPVAVGDERATFKENVRPLKRGRSVGLLNRALEAHADPTQRVELVAGRSCIKWAQESFPAGG